MYARYLTCPQYPLLFPPCSNDPPATAVPLHSCPIIIITTTIILDLESARDRKHETFGLLSLADLTQHAKKHFQCGGAVL
jgi:hypothetical protein